MSSASSKATVAKRIGSSLELRYSREPAAVPVVLCGTKSYVAVPLTDTVDAGVGVDDGAGDGVGVLTGPGVAVEVGVGEGF